MNYKHLSEIERYQIASLMKAPHSITQIVSLIGRHKSTISRELRRNAGSRGYRSKQASELAIERSDQSRNAYTVAPWVKEQASALLRLKWSPEQVANRLRTSYETLYEHVDDDTTQRGDLMMNLRGRKKRRKRYATGRDSLVQVVSLRPLRVRPARNGGAQTSQSMGMRHCDLCQPQSGHSYDKKIEIHLNKYPIKRIGFRSFEDGFHQSVSSVELPAQISPIFS